MVPITPLRLVPLQRYRQVPNQVLGYTLTLVGENGEVYAYILSSNTITIPDNLEGKFELQITNGTVTYTGKLYL